MNSFAFLLKMMLLSIPYPSVEGEAEPVLGMEDHSVDELGSKCTETRRVV